MLFFHDFKAGQYGKFYGSLDPLVVTTALKEFLAHRGALLDKYEDEEDTKRLEEQRKSAVTFEEYCRLTGYVPDGDRTPKKS